MEKVFAVIRFKEVDSEMASDIEILMSQNRIKKDAERHAVSMVTAVGGRYLGEHESDIVLEVPLDQANIIRDIHSRIEDDVETSTTIGVGDSIRDAKLALDWAIENRPGTIKVFEPAIAQDKASSEDEDKFDYFKPEEVAMDEEGRPVHIRKSEDSWANDKEAISDETRQKIANIVSMLRQKKEYLDSLQQTNPELYAGVAALVQSISSMAQAAKESDAKDHSKLITQIAHHLDAAENSTLEDESAKVLEMLIEAQKESQEKADEEHRVRHSLAHRKFKQKHKDAREFSKKHGLDKNFLLKLNRIMRG